MDALQSNAIDPILSIARSDADPSTRVAALDAASRFNLGMDAWREVADLNFEIVDTEPANSPARREALRLAAYIPLLSARKHLRYIAENEDEPDRDAATEALDSVGDESRLSALVYKAAEGDALAFERLAVMPVERSLTPGDVPNLPVDPDHSAAFWRALLLARLGDFDALEAFLFGGAPAPDFFEGNPWTVYQLIAAVQPVPDAMRDYLLDALTRLEDGAALPQDEERRLKLTAWAATGIADAEGTPISYPETPTVPAAAPSDETAIGRITISPDFAAALFENRQDDLDLAMLRRVGPSDLSNLLMEVVDAGNARVVETPDVSIGNEIVRVVAHMPDDVDVPVKPLIERQIHVDARVLDDEQVAWILGHDTPDRVIEEATGYIESLDEGDERRHGLRILGLTGDAFTGRADSPYRGAGGGSMRRIGPAELMVDYGAAAVGLDGTSAEPPPEAAPTLEPPAPPPPEAEERDERRVNAVILLHNEVPRRTFVAGKENILRCWIGLPQEGAAAADKTILGVTIPAEGLKLMAQLKWQNSNGELHSDKQIIHLPQNRRADSSDARFSITVPAEERSVRADIAFFYRGRIFEYVRLDAAVLAEDEKERERDKLRIRVIADQRQIKELPDSQPVNAAFVAERGAGKKGALVTRFGGDGVSTGSIKDADDAVRWLSNTLAKTVKVVARRRVRQGASEDVLDAADKDVRVLLRDMARHGATLYNALTGGDELDVGERIQLLTTGDRYVPLEFVYDRGYPNAKAEVCTAGVEALVKGDAACPKCTKALTPRERVSASTICPFGFWSMSKVIERVPEGEEAADRGTRPNRRSLPPIDSTAFASTHEVTTDERTRTSTLIAAHFASHFEPEDWPKWLDAIEEKPGLLVIIAHHGVAEGLDYLEIGDPTWDEDRGKLNRGQITSAYVNLDGKEPGPIVLLLGCQTGARGSTGYVGLSEVFRRERASIVLGTLAEILASQAGPLARELVTELASVNDPKSDFGTVLLHVRRRLLARGYLLALCLYAVGDAEWRLSPLSPRSRKRQGNTA